MIDYLILGSTTLHVTSGHALTQADGLVGPPSVRSSPFDRPENDGSVESIAQFLGGRLVVLEGIVWSGSIPALWADWSTLTQAFYGALSTDTLLKWRSQGGTVDLQGNVRLAAEAMPQLKATEPVIRYQVQLRAADPRWYSQTLQSSSIGPATFSGGIPLPIPFPIPFGTSSGGTMTVVNGGTVSTWPVLTVAGPINQPVVGNSTRSEFLYFDGLNLGAGQTLIVDCNPASRSATVAGASVLGSLRWSASTFPMLDAGVGGNVFLFYAQAGGTGGGTQLTVQWRNAYLSGL